MADERILVIDDDPANLKLMRVLLSTEGYLVRTAADASEAFEVLKEFTPQLLIVDIQLPGIDGLELTRQLRCDPTTRNVPMVGLTAYAMKGDEERILAAGLDGYISKPIDTRTVTAAIASYLRQASPSTKANRSALQTDKNLST
jgi:two-component system cell cycle response regulator DivK